MSVRTVGIQEVVFGIGVACVFGGVAMFSVPSAFIILGAILVLVALAGAVYDGTTSNNDGP